MKQVQIKLCREKDVDALRQFIDTHWRRGHVLSRDASLLRWQFHPTRTRAREAENLSILLAWHDERIVGMLGLIYFDFNIKGTAIPGVWLSHWLTIPESRAQGVGINLLSATHDLGYDAMFVLGANETATKVYRALGFDLLPSMPRWIGVFDARKTARLLAEVNPEIPAEHINDACARCRIEMGSKACSNADVNIVEWRNCFAADWDVLWSSELAPTLLSARKDSSYLKWRYIDHPAFKYDIRLALKAATQKVLGLAIFRVEKIRERDETVLRILEFLATPDAENALALSLMRAGQFHNAAFADFYCTAERAAHALELMGFRRQLETETGADFPARFQPMEAGHSGISGAFWISSSLRQKLDLGPLVSSRDFYVTKSDGDQDRPN